VGKRLVLCNLKGGLGNQMFQYAAARGTFKEQSISFDHTFLNKYNKNNEIFTARKFELGIFKNLRTEKINNLFLTSIISKNLLLRILKRIFHLNVRVISDFDKCDQNCSSYNNERFIYMDGYFQSEQYFKHIRNELLEEFNFPKLPESVTPLMLKIISFNNSVGIHVRRGDYLKSPNLSFHGILDIEFYTKAIKALEQKLSSLHYFVFSDDISWCKDKLSCVSSNLTFVSTSEAAWVDMCLMSKCSHQIIANSSFSWWAAWLNKSKKKTVIAPKNWFVNPPSPIFSNLIPSDWTII